MTLILAAILRFDFRVKICTKVNTKLPQAARNDVGELSGMVMNGSSL